MLRAEFDAKLGKLQMDLSLGTAGIKRLPNPEGLVIGSGHTLGPRSRDGHGNAMRAATRALVNVDTEARPPNTS